MKIIWKETSSKDSIFNKGFVLSSPHLKNKYKILAVDLDHTLIDTDMIWEGLKYILIRGIYNLPKLILLLTFKGKTYAKKFLFDKTNIDIKTLPFNKGVINFINQHKSDYNHIILISGSYHMYVEKIAEHLDIFDSSVGTTLGTNMISENKILFLNQKFKNFVFDYIGDNKKDIPIWEESNIAYVVDNGNIINHIKHIDYKIVQKK